MGELVPSGQKFDRETLERIIRRAAELQATHQDIGDELNEQEVLDLGKEVGLPTHFVQQAILEERTQSVSESESTVIARWMGPKKLSIQRTVPGDEKEVEKSLAHWMETEELLTVKRRFKTSTSWEAKRGLFVAIRRLGGQRYALARTREILGEVTQLESGWSHVRLDADLSNSRAEYLGGALVSGATGAAMGGGALLLGLAAPLIIVPPLLGVVIGAGAATNRKGTVERVRVALEQVLDRLEHGEIKPAKQNAIGAAQVTRAIGEEVRRHFRGLGPKS